MENIIIEKNNYYLTNIRVPTRRGVIWLGQTCNLKCYFCYFATKVADKNHPEHPFFSLEKAKGMCKILREEYDFNSIDIQGGEPTIYPHIFELLDYCNSIGLKPTLITNLVSLNKIEFCRKFKEHNVYDFLVSLHGIGEDYDRIVRVKGAFKRQLGALHNLKDLDIPLRVNVVLTNEILTNLHKMAELAIEFNARVVNFLGFNNSGDQKKLRQNKEIPYYSHFSEKLQPLIDLLESRDIEVNLRFFPFCSVGEKYRKNIQNQNQKIYDIHEWEMSSRLWIDRPAQRQARAQTESLPNLHRVTTKLRLQKYQIGAITRNLLRSGIIQYTEPLPYQKRIFDKIQWYNPPDPKSAFSLLENYYFELNQLHNDKVKVNECKRCDLNSICDGLHSDYVSKFGNEAAMPIQIGQKVSDPCYYMRNQLKVVEKEERSWAMDPFQK